MILNQRLNKQSKFHKKHTLAHISRQVGGVAAHQKQQKERWNFALSQHSSPLSGTVLHSRYFYLLKTKTKRLSEACPCIFKKPPCAPTINGAFICSPGWLCFYFILHATALLINMRLKHTFKMLHIPGVRQFCLSRALFAFFLALCMNMYVSILITLWFCKQSLLHDVC